MRNQTQQIIHSEEESVDYSDSDADIFLNLAPVNQKQSSSNSNHQQHSIIAKMKRLIGNAYLNKPLQKKNNKPAKPQKTKTNNKNIIKNSNPQSDSYAEENNQNPSNTERQRSRDKTQKKRTNKNFQEDFQQKITGAANLSIQKQNINQNLKSAINLTINQNVKDLKSEQKVATKFDKFAEIEKQLLIPIDELPLFQKSIEEQKEEKRAKKRLDRMMQKKLKEYKVGKVKDETSNCVFNGIEDYFM